MHSSVVCEHVYHLSWYSTTAYSVNTGVMYGHMTLILSLANQWLNCLSINQSFCVHEEFYQEFLELPIKQCSSASVLSYYSGQSIMLYQLLWDYPNAIQNFIHTFTLSSYPDENVHAACRQSATIINYRYTLISTLSVIIWPVFVS